MQLIPNFMVVIAYSIVRPMQYILVKGDFIEVDLYAIQLFHKVQCIWLKGQIQAVAYIRGRRL